MTTTFKFSKMKKTINIFVAGAKALKEERNALKALAHDLNSEYDDKRIGIHIKTKSYEDFRDDQNIYNHFIEEKADIVIFVLKDKIGEHTEDEFIKAAAAYKEKKIPEIVVFLNKDRQETPEIEKIQNLLEEHLGKRYFVEYEDSEELKMKAKKRIDYFVRPTFQMNQRANKWILSSLFALVFLFAGLFIWSYFFNTHTGQTADPAGKRTPALDSTTQSLLFAGGGTVNNFIKAKGINLDEYPNAIYASMPSGTAWPLIAEEYNRRTKLQNDNEMRFVSIILSAARADKEKMLKSCQEEVFYNDACIVECYLGEDSMKVYVSNKFIDNEKYGINRNRHTISASELRNYIIRYADTKDSVYFYSTSETSGTRGTYNQYLLNGNNKKDVNELCNDKIHKYNETDPNRYFIEPYIVMGSNYYHPLNINKKDYTPYIFTDDNGKCVAKPIYLYFVAFKNKNKPTYYTIPKRIFDFLMKIEITRKAINNNNDYKKHQINAKGLIEQLTKREDYIKE